MALDSLALKLGDIKQFVSAIPIPFTILPLIAQLYPVSHRQSKG
jgi:hypothetical protein